MYTCDLLICAHEIFPKLFYVSTIFLLLFPSEIYSSNQKYLATSILSFSRDMVLVTILLQQQTRRKQVGDNVLSSFALDSNVDFF